MAVPATMDEPQRPGALVRVWRAVRTAIGGYGRHNLAQQAAAVSYRVLFSIVPLVALVLYLVDLALPDDRRQDLTDWVVKRTAGSPGLGDSVQRSLSGVGGAVSVAGIIAIVGLLWAASGMMGSIRTAFTAIWEAECGRPFVRGKLLDLALVLVAGVVALSGFAVSVIVRALSGAVGDVAGTSLPVRLFTGATGVAASVALVFGGFVVLYRLVPPRRPDWRALWPGALIGSILFQIATVAYGEYLAHFNNLSVIYGSLGALLGFLLVVYVGAVMLLLGAEIVVALPGGKGDSDGDADRERHDPDHGAQEQETAEPENRGAALDRA